MADGAQQQSPRFSAFISYNYNSGDAKFARRLHQQLETYRLPRKLRRKSGGPASELHRLKPLFRDADEMSAAADLSKAIRDALAQSDFLIVVCSPAAAKSKWVGREIEFFRTLHGDQHILAALVEGTPETSFHPALLEGARGPVEPLAADFRREGPGRRLAMLKLVGALAGVGLDELVHRDAQRHIRRLLAASGGAGAGMVVLVALTGATLAARNEAERERNEAQGLVSYMLTDLRQEAKSVGRLDLLATVNNGALRYYRGQDLARLSTAELQQRAQLLQAMGEDDEKRGDLDSAAAKFEEASRSTAALLAAKPNDPKRIFAHAQSEYWLGFIDWRKGDAAGARRGFEAYAELARRLVQVDPQNAEWQHEIAYAELNLGTLALRQAGDAAAARRHFSLALNKLLLLSARIPEHVGLQREIGDAYAWLADSQRIDRDFEGALRSRTAQRGILDFLLAKHPGNVEVRADRLGNELAIARIEAGRGEPIRAIGRLEGGQATAQELARNDPDNAEVAKQSRIFELFKVHTQLDLPPSRRPSTASLLGTVGSCESGGQAVQDPELRDFCLVLRARTLMADGDYAGGRGALGSINRLSQREIYSARWGIDFKREVALAHGDGNHQGMAK